MKKLSSKKIFEGKLLRLLVDEIELKGGKVVTREIVKHPEASAIVPIINKKGEERVILVRQYRPSVKETLWEIPAGLIEEGETPLDCAKRELLEETGFYGERWEKLISFYSSPGFCDERIHLFSVYDLEYKRNEKTEVNLKVKEFRRPELEKKIRNGKIKDSKTIIGISLLGNN